MRKLSLVTAVLGLLCMGVAASAMITITLDRVPATATWMGCGSLGALDSTRASGMTTLYYDTGLDYLTPGNLWLRETPGSAVKSDVVRIYGNVFDYSDPDDPILVANGRIYFYSDNSDGSDAPADVGIPTNTYYGRALWLTETGSEGFNGVFGYLPRGSNYYDPGYGGDINNQSSVMYNLISDVPEPISIFLGIMGLGSLAGFRRLRKS